MNYLLFDEEDFVVCLSLRKAKIDLEHSAALKALSWLDVYFFHVCYMVVSGPCCQLRGNDQG